MLQYPQRHEHHDVVKQFWMWCSHLFRSSVWLPDLQRCVAPKEPRNARGPGCLFKQLQSEIFCCPLARWSCWTQLQIGSCCTQAYLVSICQELEGTEILKAQEEPAIWPSRPRVVVFFSDSRQYHLDMLRRSYDPMSHTCTVRILPETDQVHSRNTNFLLTTKRFLSKSIRLLIPQRSCRSRWCLGRRLKRHPGSKVSLFWTLEDGERFHIYQHEIFTHERWY